MMNYAWDFGQSETKKYFESIIMITIMIMIINITGGYFACACVHPLKDNSVDASNLMAGNRKLV